MEEEMVTITKKEYDELKRVELKSIALEHAGVDNWEGYDYAIDILNELRKKNGTPEED